MHLRHALGDCRRRIQAQRDKARATSRYLLRGRDEAQAISRYLLREWTDPETREEILASLRAAGIGVPAWLTEEE
jgi:hypothetical protein